ncbi:unnamed protein product, partial [Brassica oleracea var. botrytis]
SVIRAFESEILASTGWIQFCPLTITDSSVQAAPHQMLGINHLHHSVVGVPQGSCQS